MTMNKSLIVAALLSASAAVAFAQNAVPTTAKGAMTEAGQAAKTAVVDTAQAAKMTTINAAHKTAAAASSVVTPKPADPAVAPMNEAKPVEAKPAAKKHTSKHHHHAKKHHHSHKAAKAAAPVDATSAAH